MVDIALATFNGEKYLPRFLESLLNQTYSKWHLWVRDDGSNDRTVEILQEFKCHHPGIVTIVEDNAGHVGINNNFERVLGHTTREYIMLADQDDVWLDNKIAKSVKEMDLGSRNCGSSVPLLIYSDLTVIDSKEKILSKSYWRLTAMRPDDGLKISRLLTQNVVIGCTVIMNRALLKVAIPFPREAIMHDWWLALVAVATGKCKYIKDPLILYRQHDSNAVGTQQWRWWSVFVKFLKGRSNINAVREHIHATQAQASALVNSIRADLHPDAYMSANMYATLGGCSCVARRIKAFKGGFFQQGVVRNVIFYLAL
jgi:glycosyltransferase involved in cell wall biosynthesis